MKRNTKKLVLRSLLLVWVAAFGIYFGGAVMAQFGANPVDGIDWLGTETAAPSLLGIVKSFINWILWLLSLIALGMALFGGFKMVTAAGDDGKYKEWFKVLKQAAIGLVVVGLSWIIVSAIFAIIGSAQSGTVSYS